MKDKLTSLSTKDDARVTADQQNIPNVMINLRLNLSPR